MTARIILKISLAVKGIFRGLAEIRKDISLEIRCVGLIDCVVSGSALVICDGV